MLNEFKEYLTITQKSPETIKSYLSDLSIIEKENIDILTINEIDLLKLLAKDKPNPNTLKRRLYSFSKYFIFIYKKGLRIDNPAMMANKDIKGAKRLPKPFNAIELELLFEKITNPEHKLLFRFILETGIRVSEVSNISIFNIDLENKTIKILGKGNKERLIIIPDDLLSDVKDLMFKSKTGLLFNYSKLKIQIIFKKYCDLAGVESGVHKLRHTFATNLVNKGLQIEFVKELLGHASYNTTLNYSKVSVETIKNNLIQLYKKQEVK